MNECYTVIEIYIALIARQHEKNNSYQHLRLIYSYCFLFIE